MCLTLCLRVIRSRMPGFGTSGEKCGGDVGGEDDALAGLGVGQGNGNTGNDWILGRFLAGEGVLVASRPT